MGKKDEYIAPPYPHTSTRLQHIKNFQSAGHKVDKKLLGECAYYPRQGCEYCRWDWPYPKCDYAHILVDTRCAGVRGWTSKVKSSGTGTKKRSPKKSAGEKFWKTISPELKALIVDAINEEE